MKILNLYAGIGGNRKFWDGHNVDAVESNEQIAKVYHDLYPDDLLYIEDAHEYLLRNYQYYDFIWSSPPCQSHSKMVKFTRHDVRKYPDMKLYEEIIFLQHFFKGKWVVENVVPYYKPLIKGVKLGRHYIWANFDISPFDVKRPKGFMKGVTRKEMMDWLGVYFDGNIYYEGNHEPLQVFRNCVHPALGLHILKESQLFNPQQ